MLHESAWWRPFRENDALDQLKGEDYRVINAMMHYAVRGDLFTWRSTIAERAKVSPEVVSRTYGKLIGWGVLDCLSAGSWKKAAQYRFVTVNVEDFRKRIAGSTASDPERRRSQYSERRRSGRSRRSIDQEQELTGAAGKTAAKRPAAADARSKRGGFAPTFPTTATGKALLAAGVGQPMLGRLETEAALSPELVKKLAKQLAARGKGVGVLVEELRKACMAAGSTPEDADELLVKWQALTSDQRREIWAAFVQLNRDTGNFQVPKSPDKEAQRVYVTQNRKLRAMIRHAK